MTMRGVERCLTHKSSNRVWLRPTIDGVLVRQTTALRYANFSVVLKVRHSRRIEGFWHDDDISVDSCAFEVLIYNIVAGIAAMAAITPTYKAMVSHGTRLADIVPWLTARSSSWNFSPLVEWISSAFVST